MSFGENVVELVDSSQDPLIEKATNWPRVPLGEIAVILNGFPWKSERFNNSTGAPLIRIRDVTTGQTETFYNGPVTEGYWIDPGDLLVGMDGDFNVRRWSAERGLLNQRVCKITAHPDQYNTYFLEYLLPGYLRLINQATSSVTVKHLSSRTLAELPLPLPPLPEQHRIAAKLDTLTARIARARTELDRVSVLAERIRFSILNRVFGATIRNDWSTLADVGLTIEAGKNLKCEEHPPHAHELGVVKVSAVSSEIFRPHESKTLPVSYRPPQRDRINVGDLLLARASGSLNLVGRVALVKEAPSNLYLSDKVLRLRVPGGLTNWIYWFLRSPVGRTQVEGAASGISMHNITQGSLLALRLPLLDNKKRDKCVTVVNATFARADRLEAEAARARALLDRLESTILAKAFRGELVPQDENDEPASVLLERIRAQRAAAPKKMRATRRAGMGG